MRNSNSFGFATHGGSDIGIVLARHQSLWKNEFRQIVPFGLQPCHARAQLIQPLGHYGEISAGLGGVETHDDVASLYPATFAHQNFTDDATLGVLYLLI